MAKSVLDAGWGMLKAQLQYKGQQAGRCVLIVSEKIHNASMQQLQEPSRVLQVWTCSL